MEQIVITANQLATLIEASYFYNFVAVLSALLVYDVLGAFLTVGLSNLRAYLEKRSSSKEDH
ncbi:hypothetical protein [Vibrio cholerae]|uniref:hypothetical protein n=1 Tax=Vibrio cholerae TaxID=666 RepID=UPI000763850B|nr:hypothetical protein [Vibrio cholerae]EGR2240028.1 hypothetical protein [Vibrio cholerae]KWW43306.1 hypothetical protein GJ26_18530 [Vibrio cholerae]TYW44129.1 hypothetical protein FY556_11280 [Vibrio cholerae]TYW49674.1 hypothetical protein FY558_12660 [Vibrio cholerae]HAS3567133.1 hypothetical protein [Vibrio cholerae]